MDIRTIKANTWYTAINGEKIMIIVEGQTTGDKKYTILFHRRHDYFIPFNLHNMTFYNARAHVAFLTK